MKLLLIALFLFSVISSAVYAGEPETCPRAHPTSCGGARFVAKK